MTNRFMVSVAALALLAGTGFANAQSREPGGSTGGSTMQHSGGTSGASSGSSESKSGMTTGQSSQDASKGNHAESKSGTTTGQSSQDATKGNRAQDATKGNRAEDATKGNRAEDATKGNRAEDATKGNRAEDNVKGGSTKERAEDRAKGADTNRRAEENKGMKANERSPTTGQAGGSTRENENMKSEGHEGRSGTTEMNRSHERSQTEMNRSGERSQTTGQAAGGAKLSSDQRTKITTVFRNEKVQPESNVNFSVSVGSRVPREGVSLHPLPSEVVTIYPEWRGYEFIRVHDQILVVDPNTYEIVAVLEA